MKKKNTDRDDGRPPTEVKDIPEAEREDVVREFESLIKNVSSCAEQVDGLIDLSVPRLFYGKRGSVGVREKTKEVEEAMRVLSRLQTQLELLKKIQNM